MIDGRPASASVRAALLSLALGGLGALCPSLARAQQGPAVGPDGGAGERGVAAAPTLVLAWGALGWGLLLVSVARRGRAPAAAGGSAGPYRPGLHWVEGEAAALLRGLLGAHRVLLVGPVPAGLLPSEYPSGTLFCLGESAVPVGRLLRAKAQLEGLGAPLVVVLLSDPVDLTGEPALSLEAIALRRLNLPVLRLHMHLQFTGDPLPSRTLGATSRT
jgi:hypothetical protein